MNTNFSNKNKFKIIIHNKNGNNLEFLAKTVTGCGFNIGITEVQTPAKVFKIAGNTYASDDLSIEFYLDENWSVYLDLLKWIKEIRSSVDINSKPMYMNNITIEVLNTKYKFNFYIECKDCFPYSITSVNLDADDDITPLMCQVDFACNDYDIIQK